jgi:hypothetical protein
MLQISRQGQLYRVIEGSYGAASPSFAAGDAIRHLNFLAPFDPKNREHNPEKKTSPGRFSRFDRRETGTFSLEAMLRPSGTLNTLPECAEELQAAFGTQRNVTLATTVSSGGTVSGATLASGAGLAIGDSVLITCPDTKKRVRRLASVAGAVVTWAPQLPAGQQPANGAAVKAGISYALSTVLTTSLAYAHYLKKTDLTAGLSRLVLGAGADKLALTFDANGEPRFTVSGPAKNMGTAGAQPGSFTMVGGNPPSGLIGELALGTGVPVTSNRLLKLAFDLTNGLKVRNESYGFSSGEELFRVGRRDITCMLDCRVEDQTAIYDLSMAGTNTAVHLQTGFTEGNILAVYAPNVEFKVPDTDDGDEEANWPFKGVALESAIDGNDELWLAIC